MTLRRKVASAPYRKLQVGTVDQYRTQAAARRALDAMRLDINKPTRSKPMQMTVVDLIEHYTAKELGKDRHSKAETTVEVADSSNIESSRDGAAIA